jgi:hypothetical protein
VSALVLATAGAGGVAFSAPAEAATPGHLDPGVAVSGILDRGTVWLGAMEAPQGYGDDLVFCVKSGGSVPGGTVPAREDIVTDPVLAAIMARHRWTNDAWTRAAISYLAHLSWEEPSNGVSAETRKARYRSQTPQVIRDHADALVRDGMANAGPFTAVPASPAGSGTRTGDVHNIGVRNASGGWTSGLPFAATLVGPAVFTATGTATYSGTTESGPLTLPWRATGTGPVTFQVSFQNVPRVTLTRVAGSGNVQTVVTYGHRTPSLDPSEISPPPVPFNVVGQFQPVASTAVGSKTVAIGDELVDQVTVGTAQGDTWLAVEGQPVPVKFVGTAYSTGTQPAAEPGPVPADAVVLGTTELTVTGPGTYQASVPGAGAGQFVTWVWRMAVAEQPGPWQQYLRADWQDAFGLPEETTSVRHRAQVSSQVVVENDAAGRPAGLADDVVVAGFPDDHPDFAGGAGFTADRPTIAQSLWYFPPGTEVSDANRGAATLLGQVDLPAANGTYASVGAGLFTLPRTATGAGVPGTYVFTHAFAGDDRVEPFETSVTVASEQFLLEPRPPALATVAIAERAVVHGDQAVAHDVATVTGDIPVGATITFELYEWPAGGPAVCSSPVWSSSALTLAGEGDVVSPSGDVLTLTGDLGFVAVVRDVDGRVLVRGECGDPAETLLSGAYAVVTTASSDRTAVFGDQVVVRDVATVTGTVPTDATLTFELYTWPTGTGPVCDEPVWTSAPVPLVVGETATPEVRIDPVTGDLGFVEVVHGSDGRELSRGVCGAPDETIVDDVLTVTTVAASDEQPVLGRSVTVRDVATMVGSAAPGTTLTFELYTWPSGGEPSCVTPLWTSDPIPLTGPGQVTSDEVTVELVTGTLGFVEVTRGADGRVLGRSACGEPTETLAAIRELAQTGGEPWPLVAVAAGLLVVGVLAVAVARRRVRG